MTDSKKDCAMPDLMTGGQYKFLGNSKANGECGCWNACGLPPFSSLTADHELFVMSRLRVERCAL